MTLKNKTAVTVVACILCIVLAICSIRLAAPVMGDVDHYASINKSLDDKRSSVIEISSILVGLSVIIGAVPGDATTPISTQITQLGSYLVIALSAIMFEKILLPLLGIAVFKYVMPITLLILCLYFIFGKKKLLEISVHLLILCIVLMLTIPVGVRIGDIIDDSFGTDHMIADLQAELENIEKTTVEDSAAEESVSSSETTGDENTSIFKSLFDKVSNTANDITEKVTQSGKMVTEKVRAILGKLMDVVAVIIITDIVLPILMLLVMGWVLKTTFTNLFHFSPEITVKPLLPEKKEPTEL